MTCLIERLEVVTHEKILHLSIIFSGLMLFFLMAAGADAAESKQTIAVLDFESVGSEAHFGKAVSEIMRTELISTRQFRVVERAQINKALSEQQLQRSGLIDDKSAVQIGKLIGADLMIVGSVVKIGASYTINSRMIDVKTGEAKLGQSVSGNDLNLLTSLSHDRIENLFGLPKKKEPKVSVNEQPAESKAPVSDPSKSLLGGAVNWGNGKACFFRGNQYIRFDVMTDRADSGYPKPVNSGSWPGMVWTGGINAVVNWGNGKAYFFRGDSYMRYDMSGACMVTQKERMGAELASLLDDGKVLCHPLIVGELACGNLKGRSVILSFLQLPPMSMEAEHQEVLSFIGNNRLM